MWDPQPLKNPQACYREGFTFLFFYQHQMTQTNKHAYPRTGRKHAYNCCSVVGSSLTAYDASGLVEFTYIVQCEVYHMTFQSALNNLLNIHSIAKVGREKASRL
jgi:hypothetical protein